MERGRVLTPSLPILRVSSQKCYYTGLCFRELERRGKGKREKRGWEDRREGERRGEVIEAGKS